MKTLAFCVLVLAVVVGCEKSPEPASVATEQPPIAEKAKPAPEPLKDVPPALVEIFEKQNQLHKRQTGALLTITAKWEKGEKTEAAVVIDWSIDYNGPRHPFTILTPGDNYSTEGRTKIYVWYLRPDGKPSNFEFGFGGGGELPLPKQKGWFSVAINNKPVTGKIYHGQSYMKGHFGYRPNPGTPPLWVQMECVTTDHGDANGVELGFNDESWTLDAWTGKLWSSVVEVAVQ